MQRHLGTLFMYAVAALVIAAVLAVWGFIPRASMPADIIQGAGIVVIGYLLTLRKFGSKEKNTAFDAGLESAAPFRITAAAGQVVRHRFWRDRPQGKTALARVQVTLRPNVCPQRGGRQHGGSGPARRQAAGGKTASDDGDGGSGDPDRRSFLLFFSQLSQTNNGVLLQSAGGAE